MVDTTVEVRKFRRLKPREEDDGAGRDAVMGSNSACCVDARRRLGMRASPGNVPPPWQFL